MAHQISVVAWGATGKDNKASDTQFMINTPSFSYLYDLAVLRQLEDISKRNVGLWQLSLICDLSKLAKKYIGCPFTWRPQSHLWGFDALLRGEPVLDMQGLLKLLPKKQRIDLPWNEFGTMWWEHMADRADAGPGVGPGGDTASPVGNGAADQTGA